jgi:hypothetical protein
MMNLGMACGFAAVQAKDERGDFHSLDREKLQGSLEQAGQIIHAPER